MCRFDLSFSHLPPRVLPSALPASGLPPSSVHCSTPVPSFPGLHPSLRRALLRPGPLLSSLRRASLCDLPPSSALWPPGTQATRRTQAGAAPPCSLAPSGAAGGSLCISRRAPTSLPPARAAATPPPGLAGSGIRQPPSPILSSNVPRPPSLWHEQLAPRPPSPPLRGRRAARPTVCPPAERMKKREFLSMTRGVYL